MENNAVRVSRTDRDEEIDLKELFLYVCRGWRVLIALLLVGLLLGAGYGALKARSAGEQASAAGKPNAEYDLYLRLFDGQQKWIDESVYLSMDAASVYQGNLHYLLKTGETDRQTVARLYLSVLDDSAIYDELLAQSGLDCSPQAVRELVQVTCEEGVPPTVMALEKEQPAVVQISVPPTVIIREEEQPTTVQVSVSVVAPDEAACQRMLAVLDARMQEISLYAAQAYGAELTERLVPDSVTAGFNTEVMAAQKEAAETLSAYMNKLKDIEKKLTDAEKVYYGLQAPAAPGRSEWLKWALIVGMVLCALGVFAYAVAFVLDGHIKNEDELLEYGLHPFALIEGGADGKKRNALDRLFSPRLRYQSDAYLAQVLELLDAEHIVLCGDLNDSIIAAHGRAVVSASRRLSLEPQMAESADAQMKVRQADGVVLLVHLWHTKRSDLVQELRICRKLRCDVLGVAVIG